MHHRVFVSSTYSDLKDYRAAVQDAIRQLGALDVSMEHFGARDERPKVECLRLITEETDSFVGIYAHRYGHVPNKDTKSVTESEFDAASQARKPRFVYLVDEEAPWNPKLIDTGKVGKRLADFKARVKEELICKSFGSRDQLATHVVADLGRHLATQQLKRVKAGFSSDAPSLSTAAATATEWNVVRDSAYKRNRGVFLVHTLAPSKERGQLFDIHIFLRQHRKERLSDVNYAEFFLGRYWGSEVLPIKNEGGYVGISTSAYGEFLCVCRVTFTDGYRVSLERYIDFGSYSPPLEAPN